MNFKMKTQKQKWKRKTNVSCLSLNPNSLRSSTVTMRKGEREREREKSYRRTHIQNILIEFHIIITELLINCAMKIDFFMSWLLKHEIIIIVKES